jgi:hypothetical protein
MNKATIIPILTEKLTDPKTLSEHLLMLEKHEWDLFQKAVKSQRISDDTLLGANYRFVLELGIMALYYSDYHFHYVVPEEIQKTYIELEKAGFPAEKEHGDLLNDRWTFQVGVFVDAGS